MRSANFLILYVNLKFYVNTAIKQHVDKPKKLYSS